MEKKRIGYGILYMVTSAVMMLAAASRTSPFYSLLMGDYSGNPASHAMLVGKYWGQGEIPYRDLFIVGSPVYFLIQAIGWLLGGRTGIFVLEIINYTVFMILEKKTVGLFVPEKEAALAAIFSVIPFAAFCSGGNSGAEWCLPWLAFAFYLVLEESVGSKTSCNCAFLLGIICAIVLLVEPVCGGVIYGLIIYVLGTALVKKGTGNCWRVLCLIAAGVAVLLIPVIIYFSVCGAVIPMLQGAFGYSIKMLPAGFERPDVIIHKFVKCFLVLPLLGAGIYKVWKEKESIGYCLLSVAIGNGMILFLGDNSWCDYISAIPGVLLAGAVFWSRRKSKISIAATGLSYIVIIILCLVPLRNYVQYLVDGVPEVAEELYEDILSFRKEMENGKIIMVDTDSSYYLMADEKPICRYFADQTELSRYEPDTGREIEEYLDGTKEADVLLTTEKGWTGQRFDNFTLVQVYLKKGGNLCVYLPDSY